MLEQTNMGDADDDPQVQTPSFERTFSTERAASRPEDQAAMTIEFLRARLLAERSISKAARQRAQQLAMKVSELEQRVESEVSMRRKLEEVRWEVISKHKEEFKEDLGHAFMDQASHDANITSQQQSLAHSEHKPDVPEGLVSTESTHVFEGLMKNPSVQENDGGEDDDDDDNDGLASEKGMLAWASRRSKQRLQVKDWAQSPRQLKRSFSPRFFGSVSPDSDSPRKRLIGKSVRQIRTRSSNVNVGGGEVKHDTARESRQFDEAKDELERVLDHQTNFTEQTQAEEIKQRVWEEEFREQICLEDETYRHQQINLSREAQHKDKEVVITSYEQITEDESQHGNFESAEKVDAFIKHYPGEADESLCDDSMYLAIELAEINCEGSSIAQDVVTVNSGLPKDLSAEKVNKETKENTSYGRIPKEDNLDMFQGDGQEGQIGVVTSCSSPNASDNVLVNVPSLGVPDFHSRDENELNSRGQRVGSNIAKSLQKSSAGVSADLNFYASPHSSSQGSNSSLDRLSYQKHDLLLGYANNRHRTSENMSRDSCERAFKDHNFCFVKSPSTTSESDKPFKSSTYEYKPKKFSCSSTNEDASYGSSKGLMNSSWDEIFKRKIKSQEAGNAKEQQGDAHNSGLPPFHDGVETSSAPCHVRTASESFGNRWRSPHYDPYSSPYQPNAYEQRRYETRIRHKSVDAGLDRVMDVLRALQLAKQQVEGSNEHAVNECGYSSRVMPNVSPNYPSSWSPKRRVVEPLMYDTEDSHRGVYMHRSPLSMQYACMRTEPMAAAGEPDWRQGYYGYPPYPSLYR